MDIHTGDILSMVSLPDFDLNKREKISDKKYNFFMYKIISAIKKKRARSPLLNMCLN